jgi:hypothetical protein
VKSQRFGANDGDACWCCNPLEGVVLVTLSMLGLLVKSQDPSSLGNGGSYGVVTSVVVLSWNPGLLSLTASSVASARCFLVFYYL